MKNWKTRFRFRKPHGLTAIQEVHSKNIISGFINLKNQNDDRFSIIPVQPYGPV